VSDLSKTLYRPEFEHDACGIGFIARPSGAASHDVIKLGLEAVGCMEHRSGIDADGLSGDGAGILSQIPHQLLADEIADLPAAGDYALGMFFLPHDETDASILIIENILQQILSSYQVDNLAESKLRPAINGSQAESKVDLSECRIEWRTVPIEADVLGETARRTRPLIRQAIIHRPARIAAGEQFERVLFAARRRLDTALHYAAGLDDFYVASLSAQTVVYKGLMLSPYLGDFYLDLTDPRFESAMAVIHTRYSTNTTSNWQRAQPFRMIAHNGEINTLQGNVNWMRARESTLKAPFWAAVQDDLGSIIDPGGSDSGQLDNVLELLVRSGRDIHHSVAMLAPEAWENLINIHPDRHAFYRYHAALMEPWDGPAAIIFTDGRRVGATLDRNGLRPMRLPSTKARL
jgi:glutamate synthase (ferredoxin)